MSIVTKNDNFNFHHFFEYRAQFRVKIQEFEIITGLIGSLPKKYMKNYPENRYKNA